MIPYKYKLPSPPARQILSNTSPPQYLDRQKRPWFQARKYLNLKDRDFKRFLEEKAPFNHYSQKLILKKFFRQAKYGSRELLVASKKHLDFYKSLASDIRKITYSNLRSSKSPTYRQKIKSFRLFKHVTTLNIREYPNAFTPKNLQYLPNLKTLSISLTSSKLEPISSKKEKSKLKLKLKRRIRLDHLNLKVDSDCFDVESYPYWVLHCLCAQKELKTLNLDATLLWELSHFSRKPIILMQSLLSGLLSQKNLSEFQISLQYEIQNLLLSPNISPILQTVENIQLWKNYDEDFSTRIFSFPIKEQSQKVLILHPSEKLNIPNLLNQATSLQNLIWNHSLASIFSLEQIPDYLCLQHLDLLIADFQDWKLLLSLCSHIKSLESLSLNVKFFVSKILFDPLIELPALKYLKEFNLAHVLPQVSYLSSSEVNYFKILELNELENFNIQLPSGFSVRFDQRKQFSLDLTGRQDLEKFANSMMNFQRKIQNFTAHLRKCPGEKIHFLLRDLFNKNFNQIQEFHLTIDFDEERNDLLAYSLLQAVNTIFNSNQLRNLSIQIGEQKLITLKTQEDSSVNKRLELEISNLNDLKGVYDILSLNPEGTFGIISSCSIVCKEMDLEVMEFLLREFHNLQCLKSLKQYSLELKSKIPLETASNFLRAIKIPHVERLSVKFPDVLEFFIENSKQSINASLFNQELVPDLKDFLGNLSGTTIEEFSLRLNEADHRVGKLLQELNTSTCLQNVAKYSFCSHLINNNNQSWAMKASSSNKSLLVNPQFLADFKIPSLSRIKALSIQCSRCIVIKCQVSEEGKKNCQVQFQNPLYLETFMDFANDLDSIDNFELTITEPDYTVGELLGKLHQHPTLNQISQYSLKFEKPLSHLYYDFKQADSVFLEAETLYKMQIHALKFLQNFSFHLKGKSNVTLDDLSQITKDLQYLRDLEVDIETREQHPLKFSLSALEGIENLKIKLNFQKEGVESLCQQISTLKSLKRLHIESLNSDCNMTFKPTAITSILRHSYNIMELMIKTYHQTFTLEDLEKYKQNEANRSTKQKFRNYKRHYY